MRRMGFVWDTCTYTSDSLNKAHAREDRILFTTKGQNVPSSALLDTSVLEPCFHEEADYRMMLHCFHAYKLGRKKMLHSTNTDALVFALWWMIVKFVWLLDMVLIPSILRLILTPSRWVFITGCSLLRFVIHKRTDWMWYDIFILFGWQENSCGSHSLNQTGDFKDYHMC